MMVRASRDRALLARGDRVAIVATGFACRPEALERGVDVVARLGFRPVVGRHALDRAAYFAGDDAARLDDLNRALADRTIRGIWCARGGYGTARLLAGVDWDAWARDPKILIGYSDVSALVSGALARTRAVSLHGPVVAELGDPAAWHAPSLRASLAGRETTLRVARRQVLVPGRARGRLVGGNLTVLCHLLGTPWAPPFDGSILLLEEAGEEAYRVDRLLVHLAASGGLGRVRGVLLGMFDVPRTRRVFPPDRRIDDLLVERFASLGIPVVRGLPVGHGPGKRTVPIGGTAAIDTARGTVVFGTRPRR